MSHEDALLGVEKTSALLTLLILIFRLKVECKCLMKKE